MRCPPWVTSTWPWAARRPAAALTSSMRSRQWSGHVARAASEGQMDAPDARWLSSRRITCSSSAGPVPTVVVPRLSPSPGPADRMRLASRGSVVWVPLPDRAPRIFRGRPGKAGQGRGVGPGGQGALGRSPTWAGMPSWSSTPRCSARRPPHTWVPQRGTSRRCRRSPRRQGPAARRTATRRQFRHLHPRPPGGYLTCRALPWLPSLQSRVRAAARPPAEGRAGAPDPARTQIARL